MRRTEITPRPGQASPESTGPYSGLFKKSNRSPYGFLCNIGVTIAWYPGFTHQVIWAALWDFMQQFQTRGIAAWEDFVLARRDRPYPHPEPGPQGEGLEKQRELEERYFSAAVLAKYRGSDS